MSAHGSGLLVRVDWCGSAGGGPLERVPWKRPLGVGLLTGPMKGSL
jgi:hypothetical protein